MHIQSSKNPSLWFPFLWTKNQLLKIEQILFLIYHRPSPAGQSRHLVILNVWDSLKKKFLTLVVCLVSLIVCAGDKIARPVLADDSSSHYLSCITLHDNNTTSLFQHYKTNYCAHPNLLHYLVPIIPLLSKSRELFYFIQSFYFPKINPVLSLLGCFLLYKGNQLHSSLL